MDAYKRARGAGERARNNEVLKQYFGACDDAPRLVRRDTPRQTLGGAVAPGAGRVFCAGSRQGGRAS